VCDGSRARFWNDTRCGDHPLRCIFRCFFFFFFFCARDKDALLADHMLAHNNEVHWDMNFIRLVHGWKVDTVSSFLNALYSARRSRRDKDKCCWVPSKRQSFEVKTFYKVLLPDINYSFHWKNIWRSKAPLRVVFFT